MSSWREEFLSEIPEMDREHKRCMELGDLVIEAVELDKGQIVTTTIFDNFVGHLFNHFIAEELLMKDYSYPLLAEHEAEHKKFIEHVASVKDKTTNDEINLTKDMIIKLQVAFAKHVIQADNQFVAFFNERNNKKH